jgi:hypothetical protein
MQSALLWPVEVGLAFVGTPRKAERQEHRVPGTPGFLLMAPRPFQTLREAFH